MRRTPWPWGRLYKGLPDFLFKGRVPRLQISYWRDGSLADINIDYRGLWEGYLRPYNSDVMARGPAEGQE